MRGICFSNQYYILLQMHFLRATVLQEALSAPLVSVPRSIPPVNVVSDYCSCHRMEDNVTALTEALVFAVDNRKSHVTLAPLAHPLCAFYVHFQCAK